MGGGGTADVGGTVEEKARARGARRDDEDEEEAEAEAPDAPNASARARPKRAADARRQAMVVVVVWVRSRLLFHDLFVCVSLKRKDGAAARALLFTAVAFR